MATERVKLLAKERAQQSLDEYKERQEDQQCFEQGICPKCESENVVHYVMLWLFNEHYLCFDCDFKLYPRYPGDY